MAIKDEEAYFKYLDRLRESGVTNMFGASPFLQKAFAELTELEARQVLVKWMEFFSKKE